MCWNVHKRYELPPMTTTLSVRIDTDTKRRLEALAKRARRSKSFLAAAAIAAFVETESWQLDEIQTGIKELDEGRGVPHKDVANWLRSWGRKRERKAPACDHRLVAASHRASGSSPRVHRARQSKGRQSNCWHIARSCRAARRAAQSGPSWSGRWYAGTGRTGHTVHDPIQAAWRPARGHCRLPRAAEMA